VSHGISADIAKISIQDFWNVKPCNLVSFFQTRRRQISAQRDSFLEVFYCDDYVTLMVGQLLNDNLSIVF